MIIKRYFSLIFLMCLGMLNAQILDVPVKKNHLELSKIKGKIDWVRTIPYEIVEKDGKIMAGEILGCKYNEHLEGIFIENSLKKFNEKGYLIEREDYTPNGLLSSKLVYKYDENGNYKEKQNEDFTNNFNEKSIYHYEEKNMIEISKYRPKSWIIASKRISIFDERKNVVEKQYYDLNGTLFSKSIYRYDENDNPIEWIMYRGRNELTLDSKMVYEYDEQGNHIEFRQYDKDENLFGRLLFKHNENKDVVEEIWYNEEGKIYSKTEYQYEYDAQNNWTKKIEYKNGKPIRWVERIIKYN